MRTRTAACVVMVIAMGGSLRAEVETLEAGDLRLEVTTGASYSYRLLEISSGLVLVQQNQTALTIGGTARTAVAATLVVRTATSLELSLSLGGVSDTATAVFAFDRPDALRVELAHDLGTATRVREQFADQGERYYGLFEYPFTGALDNRGLDCDLVGYGGASGTNYANARAPFYWTTRNYGIYADSNAFGRYTVAASGNTRFYFDEPSLTYHVIHGSPAEIMQVYNDLAGGTYMPPDWAFSTIWWRNDHHDDLDGLPDAQSRLLEDALRLQQLAIPAGGMWIDRPYTTGSWGWGGLDAQHDRIVFDDEGATGGDGFPNPVSMIAELDSRGMELMVWIANRHAAEMLDEALARGYVFDGWESKTRPAIDLSDPAAYGWFAGRLDSLYDIGVRGYKIDRGHEGEMPVSAENRNVPLCHQMAAQTMGIAPAGPNASFILARNLYDRSRRYASVWNGDTETTFAGLQVSLKNLLRCSNMNFPVWGSDTGGYSGTPSKELFARWLGFSAYTPTMEILIGPYRTIWDDYDSEFIDITRTHCRTHHDLLPYVRSGVYRAQQTGRPVARPLVFDHPDDANVADMWDEYLLGDALLVAPIVEAGATSRTVYLPATGEKWLCYTDQAMIHDGGQTVSCSADLDEVPVFLRAGEMLLVGDVLQANQRGADWTGTPWSGPRLRVEAFVTTDSFATNFDYHTGGAAPAVIAIDLSRSSGRIDLTCDLEVLPQPLACRFFVDTQTWADFYDGELSVYVNGLLADPAFRADLPLLEVLGEVARSQADLDGDYDADDADFDLLAACAGGASAAYDSACPLPADGEGMVRADLDRDGDVDAADFGLFQVAFSGSGVLALPVE